MTCLISFFSVDTTKRIFFATAHPHEDDDGSVYNFSVGYDKKNGLAYLITMLPPRTSDIEKPLDESKVITSIPASRQQIYTHSFGMTQKYFIFIQQPLTVNLWKLAASRFVGWSILETFAWNPTKGMSFVVISRENGEVVLTIKVEPFFFFHIANAYDENNQIVMDICCYPDAQIFYSLYLEETRNPDISHVKNSSTFTSQLRRYRLPIDLGHPVVTLPKEASGLDYEVLSDMCLDLPRINEKHNRLRHRYVYATCSENDVIDGLLLAKLIKVDVETKENLVWHEEGCLVSEPVFISAPDSQKEDDGVVLSSVYDTNNDNSFLLVLDAVTFTELARAEVPLRFAPSFHGRFIPPNNN
jgi:carotenoid cleavage dioxygenase-like enzyme